MTHDRARDTLTLLACPQCDHTAEVVWRSARRHLDPGGELVKIACIRRHWFLMPLADLLPADAA